MPAPEKWFKPDKTFSDKVIYEYPKENKGRILREADGGKRATDYFFEDNWEPAAYYDIMEDRWVGVNEYINKQEETENRVQAAIEKAESTPVSEKVAAEEAPPAPPPGKPSVLDKIGQGIGRAAERVGSGVGRTVSNIGENIGSAVTSITNPGAAPAAAPAVEEECPCKNKYTEGEKDVFDVGRINDMLRNPNGAITSAAKDLAGKNGERLANIGLLAQNDPTGALNLAMPSVNRMRGAIESQAGRLAAFEEQANKFKDPKYLLSTISSLNLFADLNCALGIEGVDIGIGLNVVNQNGQFAVQGVLTANVDVSKVLDNFGDFGSDLNNITSSGPIQDLQSALDGAFSKIDEVNGKLQGIMDQAAAIQNQAADFIQKITDISNLANLIQLSDSDPCFKLGKTVTGNLVTPEFLNAVRTSGFGAGDATFR